MGSASLTEEECHTKILVTFMSSRVHVLQALCLARDRRCLLFLGKRKHKLLFGTVSTYLVLCLIAATANVFGKGGILNCMALSRRAARVCLFF